MVLQDGSAEAAGLDPGRLQNAYDLLAGWTAAGKVPGAAIAVSRGGVLVEPRGFGRRLFSGPEESAAGDTVFLVASVTKPVTAAAALLLVERGVLSLQDRVCDIVPEFGNLGKEEIQIFHLLTHTSGLPDMLPENLELRQEQAPLAEFVKRIFQCGLLFRPGTQIRYQSMGTAMLGEVVERLSGLSLREFIHRELCQPLGMEATSLGLREDLAGRVAEVNLPDEQKGEVWHWNSEYWRQFGAPWGGMYATVRDLVVFLQMFLNEGEYKGQHVLGAATARAMIADQTGSMAELPLADRRAPVWGLGWRLGNSDLGSRRSFGHGGATGTLVGADPATGLAWAIFTTQPGAPLHYVANAINGAVI